MKNEAEAFTDPMADNVGQSDVLAEVEEKLDILSENPDKVGGIFHKTQENTADVEKPDEVLGEHVEAEEGEADSEESNEETEEASGESDTEDNSKQDSELLDALRNEIRALRAELDNVRAEESERAAQYERMKTEYAEFVSLFPNVNLKAVPQSVWDEVGKGIPLAAAYALYHRRDAIQRKNADAVNKKNSELTSGALSPSGDAGYYSPSEVRAMTQSEVRANYSKIIESMKHWH